MIMNPSDVSGTIVKPSDTSGTILKPSDTSGTIVIDVGWYQYNPNNKNR